MDGDRQGHVRTSANDSAGIAPAPRGVDPLMTGLPANEEIEKLILASILLDDKRLATLPELGVDDFSCETHRRIFRRMSDMFRSGEAIDRFTLANELLRLGELESVGGLSYLASLDNCMPQLPKLDRYLLILREKADLRRLILAMEKTRSECLLGISPARELLEAHALQLETIRFASPAGGQLIRRVEDLQSIFACRAFTEYLIEPELPIKAVVCLAGNSESGKTTLACAWARDVFRRGHGVLILDRDKNPPDRIRERLERLGIMTDDGLLRIWHGEQAGPVPQPNDPIVVDWVRRTVAETGKAPLIIIDSLICFFDRDEDENNARDMRRFFDRCRALTALGATVVVIHHFNRNGEARGSSDYTPASDQAFAVSNRDRAGGRLIDVVKLKVEKSRYGLSGDIEYHYAGGKMLRIERKPTAAGLWRDQTLVALLKASPGILTSEIEAKARETGIKRAETRDFIELCKGNGSIEVQRKGRAMKLFWNDSPEGNTTERSASAVRASTGDYPPSTPG